MGSIEAVNQTVSAPANPNTWLASDVKSTISRKLVTEQVAADLRELIKRTDDGSKLLFPGDEGYEESLFRWSQAAEKRAGAVLLAKSSQAISFFAKYASENAVDFAVCGGGHSTSGNSSSEGGLVINLSTMRGVKVDTEAKTATVQGGAQWSDVDDAAWEHGFATVGGTIGDTGVGGLTLGGGYGWLSGEHGLVIDSLLSCEVVLATGKVVRASSDEHSELFWGLRGAGQNFGITTEFVYKIWKQNPVWAGLLGFLPHMLQPVLGALNDQVLKAGGKSGAIIGIGRPPPAGGQVILMVPVFYDGTEEEAVAHFKKLLDVGPILNTTSIIPYNQVNRMIPVPRRLRVSSKGASFTLPVRLEFAESMLALYTKFTDELPDAANSLILWEFMDPTKINEVSPTATSFAARGWRMNIMIGPAWTDPENDGVCRQWARDIVQLCKDELATPKEDVIGSFDADKDQQGPGVYGNYDQEDELNNNTFGLNYARLQEIKAQYDPTNVFNKLFSIAPKAVVAQ